MLNIRKFLIAIGLVPAASTAIDSKGEMEVLSTGGHLRYHNGSSASNVLTADHADTVINKTINGPDNTITNLTNVNIGTAASIAYSKLSLTDSIVNADINSNAAINASKIANGSVSSVEFQYLDGVTSSIQTQLDAKASTTLTSAHLYVGNGSNVATDVAVSGDLTLSNTGNFQIASDVIVNADVNSAAAIAYSKLNLALSIINADIGTTAAIARTKIAAGTANHVIINDGSGNLSSEASLLETRGGTHQTTYTTGDLLYASASNTLSKLAIGSNSQVLKVTAGLPSWANSSGGSGSGIASSGIGTLQTADYAIQLSDNGYVIPVQTTTTSLNLTLPSPGTVGAGYNVTIKDYSGNSSNFPITILQNAGELIDGGDAYDTITTNFQAVSYVTDGTNWYRAVNYSSGNNLGIRGVWGGGESGGEVTTIDYVVISTTGNASSFGALTTATYALAGAANGVRGIWGGGVNNSNGMSYITVATTGNATSFGTMVNNKTFLGASANNTRALFAGGTGSTGTCEYVTIATTGNGTNFGNLTVSRTGLAGLSSSTRAVFGGSDNVTNTIDYYTIASTGAATDFGDLTTNRHNLGAASNTTRGLFAGGSTDGGANSNIIDYITIASTGNATSFGTLTTATANSPAGCANATRALFGSGDIGVGATPTNVIWYLTIASTGNSTSFGNLTVSKDYRGALANYGK